MSVANKPPADDFKKIWNEYSNTSEGLFCYYNLIKAPYGSIEFLTQTLEMELKNSNREMSQEFYLLKRGSIPYYIAINGKSDIDLDMVISRSWCSKEEMEKSMQEQPSAHPILQIDYRNALQKFIANTISNLNFKAYDRKICDVRHQLLCGEKEITGDITVEIHREILPISIKQNKSNESLRCYIPLVVTVNGLTSEVDLFPKFIDSSGMICGLTRELKWESISPINPLKKFSDTTLAAVITSKASWLPKYWFSII